MRIGRLIARLRRFVDAATIPSYGSCGGGDPAAFQRDIERRRAERKAAAECQRFEREPQRQPR